MIYIGADHRGYTLKEKVKLWLQEWNLEFEDMGNDHLDPEDDYPDFAKKVAARLRPSEEGIFDTEGSGEVKGIVICGSGVGVDIVANRHQSVRCGLGFSAEQIKKAREDDGINCLALAADFIDEETAKKIIETFLKTEFSGEEKKIRRISKLT